MLRNVCTRETVKDEKAVFFLKEVVESEDTK